MKRRTLRNKALRKIVHNTMWLPKGIGIPLRRWARKKAGMTHKKSIMQALVHIGF